MHSQPLEETPELRFADSVRVTKILWFELRRSNERDAQRAVHIKGCARGTVAVESASISCAQIFRGRIVPGLIAVEHGGL